MGLERPYLEGKGFASSIATRAGPLTLGVQYEISRVQDKHFTVCDLGVNFAAGKCTVVKLHTVLSDQTPRFTARLLQTF